LSSGLLRKFADHSVEECVVGAIVRVLGFCLLALPAYSQSSDVVMRMVMNEKNARSEKGLFSYRSAERSTRTDGHLWDEKVVELNDGILRRLIAIDGRPLIQMESNLEADRIHNLVAHPEDFRRLNESRRDDEAHAIQMLQLLPKAFVISSMGEEDGCVRFAFRPEAGIPSILLRRAGYTRYGGNSLGERTGK
jgi:hypothetical protein